MAAGIGSGPSKAQIALKAGREPHEMFPELGPLRTSEQLVDGTWTKRSSPPKLGSPGMIFPATTEEGYPYCRLL